MPMPVPWGRARGRAVQAGWQQGRQDGSMDGPGFPIGRASVGGQNTP